MAELPVLQRGEHPPEPARSAQLGIASLTEIPQGDRRHDQVEDHQCDEDRAARLPTAHGVIVLKGELAFAYGRR